MKHFLGEQVINAERSAVAAYLKGAGKKNWLVVYTASHFDQSPLPLLANILGAIQVQLESDAYTLALPDSETFSLAQLIQEFDIKRILVFGCSPQQLCLKINHIQHTRLPFLGVELLFSQTLEQVDQSKEVKAALWNSLKLMVNG